MMMMDDSFFDPYGSGIDSSPVTAISTQDHNHSVSHCHHPSTASPQAPSSSSSSPTAIKEIAPSAHPPLGREATSFSSVSAFFDPYGQDVLPKHPVQGNDDSLRNNATCNSNGDNSSNGSSNNNTTNSKNEGDNGHEGHSDENDLMRDILLSSVVSPSKASTSLSHRSDASESTGGSNISSTQRRKARMAQRPGIGVCAISLLWI